MNRGHNEARRAIATGYAHLIDAASTDIAPVMSGFSQASVFRVNDGNASYCLRMWPNSVADAQRISGIHQLLAFASEAGCELIPAPITSSEGSTLFETSVGLWQLEGWKSGIADFNDRPTDGRLNFALTSIARVHQTFREWTPPGNCRPWFYLPVDQPSPTVTTRHSLIDSYQRGLSEFDHALLHEPNRRFQEIGSQITMLFRRASQSVSNDLISCRETVVPIQPCIRDLWHDHLLFTEDELTGLVDFGAVAMDSVACDLSRLFGSLTCNDVTFRQKALSYYESIRPLTDGELKLLCPLDRSGVLLSGMTWLKRRYQLNNLSDNLDRVCDRMERICIRLSRLCTDLL